MSQPATRVAKNTGILYARMAITIVISLYSTRIVLNALGIADFGIFNVVAGAIAMLTFLNNAMTGVTQRFISYAEGAGDREMVRTIFNVSVVLHLIIAVLILIVLEVTGYFLFHGILNIAPHRIVVAQLVYQFMVMSTLFTIISVPYDAIINAHENMFMVAVLGILEAFLKLGIAIYIACSGYDKLMLYGLLTACTTIILLIVRRVYCSKKYEECSIRFNTYFNKAVFKEMTGFAGWNLLGATTSMLSSYGQGPVLNSFFGTGINAAQGIANQVNGQLSAFANTMLKALSPVIGKSEGAGDRDLLKNATFLGSQLSFFLLALFYIPVIIEMPLIFSVWLKNVPPYAVIFCRLLLIRSLFEQLSYVLNMAIVANGKIRKYEMSGAVILIFPIGLSILMFKIGYPPESLYIVFIISSICLLGHRIFFFSVNIGLNIRDYLIKVLIPCVYIFSLSFFAAYLPLFFLQEGFIRLGVVILLAVLFLCLAALLHLYYVYPEIFMFIKRKVKSIIQSLIKRGSGSVASS